MSVALRTFYRGATQVAVRDHVAAKTRYYHLDHQGSTQCLTDSSGAVTDEFASDAWGVQVKRTGESLNPFWYIGDGGYYTDIKAQVYYARARYYFARRAAWLSRDRFITEEGSYVYCSNSPAIFSDPSGLKKLDKKSCGCLGDDKDLTAIQGKLDAFCDAVSGKDKARKSIVAECAKDAGVDLKCLSDSCGAKDQTDIKCSESDAETCLTNKDGIFVCEDPCTGVKREVMLFFTSCASTLGGGKSYKRQSYICCFWHKDIFKRCKKGSLESSCSDALMNILHEVGHSCSGTTDDPAGEAAMEKFAKCVSSKLGF